MTAYEFYRRGETNVEHLIGILPERRRNRKRITEESILRWVKNLLAITGGIDDVFFVKVTLD